MAISLESLLVTPESTIREIAECINRNSTGVALIVDTQGRLVGTVTDGDIRRALLGGADLDAPVQNWTIYKSQPYQQPITATQGSDQASLLQLMQQYRVRQLPILDEHGTVVDLVLLKELTRLPELPVTAVIMTAAFGARLSLPTQNAPGTAFPTSQPVFREKLIEMLWLAGIRKLIVLAKDETQILKDFLRDWSHIGIEIDIIVDSNVSRAAALKLLPEDVWNQSLLLIDGEILSPIDFRAIFHFHQEHGADVTLAIHEVPLQVPYGVIELHNQHVVAVNEKPTLTWLGNAGSYVLSPSVRNYITGGDYAEIADLITQLIEMGLVVLGFPVQD